MDKREILSRIDAGWRHFNALIDSLTDAQKAAPVLPDGWTIKDVLAHITAWEQELTGWLDVANAGHEPNVPAFTQAYTDQTNAAIYRRNRDRSYGDVYAEYQATHTHDVLRAVAALPDDPADPRWKVWRTRERPWELIAGNTYGHYEEHEPAIRAAFKR